MSISQIQSDPTIFKSSPALELSSLVTKPNHIISYALAPVAAVVAGGASLLGAPASVAIALGAGVIALPHLFSKMRMGGEALRPAVFVEAEEVSPLIGMGEPIYTLRPALKAMQCMKTDSDNVKKVKGLLQNMVFFEDHFDYTGLTNGRLIDICKESVKNLAVGQSIALPCSVVNIDPNLRNKTFFGGHAMVAVIERKPEGFSITIHNAGEGTGTHYHKEDSPLIQTAYQIDDVELQGALKFIDEVAKLHAVRPKHATRILYDQVLETIGGKLAPPSNEPSAWSKGQTGGSCTGYSTRCMIKSMLNEREFREFEAHFLSLMVKTLTRGIESNRFWEQTPHHHWILKMLKLKLHAADLRPYLEKEVLELLEKPDTLPASFGGKLVEKLQIASGWPSNLNVEAFKALNPEISDELVFLNQHQMFSDYDNRNNMQKIEDESNAKMLTIVKIAKEIDLLYHGLDRNAFTKSEARELDDSLANLHKVKNKALKDFKKFQEAFNLSIKRFQEAVSPHYKTHPVNPFVAPLFQAIDWIRQNKIEEAKEHLSQLYSDIRNYSKKLNAKELSELNFVLDAFSALYRSHYPETPEALECFAAIELLLKMLRKKRESTNVNTFTQVHLYGVYKIFEEKLFHVLDGSIWKDDMTQKNERHDQKIKAQYAAKTIINH